MKIVIHAGHAAPGGLGQGAVGILNESKEAREVVKHVCDILEFRGHDVFDATVYGSMSASKVLKELADAHNRADAPLNISIHLNSSSNPGANGIECIGYPGNTDMAALGHLVCSHVETLTGIKPRARRFYTRSDLYILNHIKNSVLLIECAFVTSAMDSALWDPIKVAEGIANAITSYYTDSDETPPTTDENEEKEDFYRVQIGAFVEAMNAERLKKELEEKGYKPFIVKP